MTNITQTSCQMLKNMMNLRGIKIFSVAMHKTDAGFMVSCLSEMESDAKLAAQDLMATKTFKTAKIRKNTTILGKINWVVDAIAA
jgi:hypothetical protein